VEAHAKFNVASAVGIAKAIEPYNPMSYEEPVSPENVDAMIQMQRRAFRSPENHFIPVAPHNPNGPAAWRLICT